MTVTLVKLCGWKSAEVVAAADLFQKGQTEIRPTMSAQTVGDSDSGASLVGVSVTCVLHLDGIVSMYVAVRKT